MSADISSLATQTAAAQGQLEQLLVAERADAINRASVAGIPRARLLSPSIILDGRPVHRMHARRLTIGEPVARSLKQYAGLTRCLTDAADVRELWHRLLAFEEACGDALRGHPSTILDVPDATFSVTADRALRVFVDGTRQNDDGPPVAIPRFVYDCPTRKLLNFGHWLLDCAPQAVALSTVAPDALVLLPQPARSFQEATLSLFGIDPGRLVRWDGSPIECRRLLAFENDGRTGGGRPLSALMEVRRRLAAQDSSETRTRRVYVSRRDASEGRRWVTNEDEVEEVFRSRGFEVITMADCPLDEQVRIFQQARVVAGVSGSGLVDLLFSPPGTDVIVLLSDTLIRWYADDAGARSHWASGRRTAPGELAALGDSPRFYAHLTAAFEQSCHSFVAGDRMPLDQLTALVDEVLAGVDAGEVARTIAH